jgi:hypothetical protein
MVFTRLRTTSAIPSFDASMLVDLTHVMGLFANIGLLDSGLQCFFVFSTFLVCLFDEQ